MAGEKEESAAVEEVHDLQQGGEEAIAAAEEKQRKPQEPSGGDRKKRWKRSIREMLQLAQENIDRCGDDAEEERERRMVVVRHLRRQEEKLDEQDDDAWAAAHPPKRVPEAWVDYHRSILKGENLPRLLDEDESIAAFFPGGLDAIREINQGMRESIKDSQEHAAMVMDEYEANGYIEHLDAEDFQLTPELQKFIWK